MSSHYRGRSRSHSAPCRDRERSSNRSASPQRRRSPTPESRSPVSDSSEPEIAHCGLCGTQHRRECLWLQGLYREGKVVLIRDPEENSLVDVVRMDTNHPMSIRKYLSTHKDSLRFRSYKDAYDSSLIMYYPFARKNIHDRHRYIGRLPPNAQKYTYLDASLRGFRMPPDNEEKARRYPHGIHELRYAGYMPYAPLSETTFLQLEFDSMLMGSACFYLDHGPRHEFMVLPQGWIRSKIRQYLTSLGLDEHGVPLQGSS